MQYSFRHCSFLSECRLQRSRIGMSRCWTNKGKTPQAKLDSINSPKFQYASVVRTNRGNAGTTITSFLYFTSGTIQPSFFDTTWCKIIYSHAEYGQNWLPLPNWIQGLRICVGTKAFVTTGCTCVVKGGSSSEGVNSYSKGFPLLNLAILPRWKYFILDFLQY